MDIFRALLNLGYSDCTMVDRGLSNCTDSEVMLNSIKRRPNDSLAMIFKGNIKAHHSFVMLVKLYFVPCNQFRKV